MSVAIAQSKVTAQGQISIPKDVRKRLGIGPGSVLEWEQEGDKMVVRRAGRFHSEEIHWELFGGKKPPKQGIEVLKEGIREHVRKRYARH